MTGGGLLDRLASVVENPDRWICGVSHLRETRRPRGVVEGSSRRGNRERTDTYGAIFMAEDRSTRVSSEVYRVDG